MSVDIVTSILTTLVILCWALIAGTALFFIVSVFSDKAKRSFHVYVDSVRYYALPTAFSIALVALLGSLYFSEIANYIPCEFCWYQRIGIYPLSVILLVALITHDISVRKYVLPIALITPLLSIWHILLQRVPNLEGAATCSSDAPCTTIYVNELGFISIPVMALTASLTIAFLMFFLKKGESKVER